MADIERFNYNLDKITEREVVPNFVSRLSIGEDLTNPDEHDDDYKVIIPAGSKLKDKVLFNIINTMDVSHIHNLNNLKTTYTHVHWGDTSVSIARLEDNDGKLATGYRLYRIIQESTGLDVTDCFEAYYDEETDSDVYRADFDVPAQRDDTYKAYYYYTDDMPL